MNYHVLPDDKFVDEFIAVSESITGFDNTYIIYSKKKELIWVKRENIACVISGYAELLIITGNSSSNDKLFFHSINDEIVGFVNNSSLNIKIFWIVWGWDLYDKLNNNIITLFDYLHAVKGNKILNFIHHQKGPILNKFKKNFEFTKFLKKINGILHYNKYDIALLTEQFGVKVNWYPFYYRNMIDWDFFKENSVENKTKSSASKKVLLGNSGTISNNHFSVIKNKFSKITNTDIELIVPLSYGNADYIDKVLEYGRKISGVKFIPLLKFIEPKTYLALLTEIDFAIMNHIRSQGFGNIMVLIYLGKPLFLNKKCTTSVFFDDIGIKYFNVDKFSSTKLNQYYLSIEEQQKNRELIFKYFSNDLQVDYIKNIYNL